MKIIISLLFAFLLSAISQVIKDLRQRPLHRPLWTTRPTISRALLAGAIWFTRPYIDSYNSNRQLARAIAFGAQGVIIQLAVLTAFFWVAISISTHYFSATILQVISVAVIFVLGVPIILPIVSIVMFPFIIITSLPLDLLFPLRESLASKEVNRCKNCLHYRKMKKYEDTFNGLWHSKEMPRSDNLPCKIVEEATSTWESYYDMSPTERSLYPKDCSYFERDIKGSG